MTVAIMPPIVHKIVMLNANVVRCQCGWQHAMGATIDRHDRKDELLDRYNAHRKVTIHEQ